MIWSNAAFTDESSFYGYSPGISWRASKGENSINVLENTLKKFICGEHIKECEHTEEWDQSVSNIFEGKMDCEIYTSILECNTNKMKERLPKKLQWDSDGKHKSNDSLKFYIKNKIKVIKWSPYSPDLNPIENMWRSI